MLNAIRAAYRELQPVIVENRQLDHEWYGPLGPDAGLAELIRPAFTVKTQFKKEKPTG